MVQRQIVRLEDDIDGSEASQTISFALEGQAYEIDLNDHHAAQLRDSFAHWIGNGRKAAPRGMVRVQRRATSVAADRERLAAIRDWARSQGLKVSERGRIASTIIDAYEASL